MKKKTWQAHRNKIKRIIEWLDEHYPQYRVSGGKRNRSHPEYERQPKRQKIMVEYMKQKSPESPESAKHIDLLDSDDEEPSNVTAVRSNEVLYQVMGPDPNKPSKGSDPIYRHHVENLRQQGTMIKACIIRAYLSSLVRPFHHLGVHCIGTQFWDEWLTTRSWECVERIPDGMQSGVNWEEDKLIFVPIFIGPAFGGHFSLLVIDRTQNKDGIFVYFDSLPKDAWGYRTARLLERELPKMPIWRTNSVFFSQVGRGYAQGSGTQDCGIFTCLYAAAYLLGLLQSKFFEREGLNIEAQKFCIAWEMATKVELLGRHGTASCRDDS